MLKLNYFLADIFILSAEKQPIKLSWRKIEWLLEISLTKKEFEILLLLLQNKGRVFSREDILAKVWQEEVYVLDRTIDVNITRLRKKIGEYGKCIVTRLGYGYCFECE